MSVPRYEPMLAVPWREPFSDPGWLFEVKWDGVRALLSWDGHTVSLRSRRGTDITATYPEIGAFEADRSCVFDGEIVAFDDAGLPSFEVLQSRMNLQGDRRIADALATTPVSYVVFDLLYDGEEIIGLPIEHRLERLSAIGLVAPLVRSEMVEGEGRALYDGVAARGLEGIVAKRRGSPYRPGVRSPDWRKVPYVRKVRAVVGGYTIGERGRGATFGSLLVGLWDGDRLRWIGSVGTGFTDKALAAIRTALDETAVEGSPFHPDPALPAGAIWVEPHLVARVEFKGWTRSGRLRAPSFKGFGPEPTVEVTWASEGPEDQ